MRKVKWWTCLLVTVAFGLAGAVWAQQPAINGQSTLDQAPQQPAVNAQQPGVFSELPPHQVNQPSATERPDRSLIRSSQPQAAQIGDAGQGEKTHEAARGELGIWLASMDGPGLKIRRVTEGSAAAQAGLRPGDVLMQVNDRWASSPLAAAEMIRAIRIGEAVKLQIWRDGQAQQLSATIAPTRQRTIAVDGMNRDQQYEVGFRGDRATANGDLSQRVMQLERQLGMVSQELQRLRGQLSQMQATNATTSTGNVTQSSLETPVPAKKGEGTLHLTSPPAGLEQPDQTSPPIDATPPAVEAPATEKSSDEDSLFK